MGKSVITKERTETAKQTEIQQELKSQLIEKENKIRDLIATKEELFKLSKIHNEKLIEKENQIRDIYRTQTELESKQIDKQNEICDIYKTQTELESKLIDKQNEIDNLMQSKLI